MKNQVLHGLLGKLQKLVLIDDAFLVASGASDEAGSALAQFEDDSFLPKMCGKQENLEALSMEATADNLASPLRALALQLLLLNLQYPMAIKGAITPIFKNSRSAILKIVLVCAMWHFQLHCLHPIAAIEYRKKAMLH